MINVHASSQELMIKSFPGLLAGFCVVVTAGAVYGWLAGQAKLTDLGIFLFAVSVFACLLDYRVAIFSREHQTARIRSSRIIGTNVVEVPLSAIQSVTIRTGKGGSSHAGVVQIFTADGANTATAMASMGYKKQRAVVNEIRLFLDSCN